MNLFRYQIQILLIMFFLSTGCLFGLVIKDYGVFHINKFQIELEGYSFQTDDIISRIEPYRHTCSFFLSKRSIANALSTIDWLKSSQIQIHYPGILYLKLQSRKPIAVIEYQNRSICMDSVGSIFDFENKSILKQIPHYHFISSTPSPAMIVPSDKLETAYKIVHFLLTSPAQILSKFHTIRDAGNYEFQLLTANYHTCVRLNSFILLNSLQRITDLTDKPYFNIHGEWDARFPDFLIIREGKSMNG